MLSNFQARFLRLSMQQRPTSALFTQNASFRYFSEGCGSDPKAKLLSLDSMKQKLMKEFDTSACEVIDPHGDMNMIQIKVESEKFKGLMPLARQRLVNEVLKEEIKLIHAVQITAKPPK